MATHAAECHVSLTATGHPDNFTCHSPLEPAGGKKAAYASSFLKCCFQTGVPADGWKWRPGPRRYHHPPLYPTPKTSITVFVDLILCLNWFSGERVPSGGQAHRGVRSPDWHHSAEEADHWQQDQGGEGEVNAQRGARNLIAYSIYFLELFIYACLHLSFSSSSSNSTMYLKEQLTKKLKHLLVIFSPPCRWKGGVTRCNPCRWKPSKSHIVFKWRYVHLFFTPKSLLAAKLKALALTLSEVGQACLHTGGVIYVYSNQSGISGPPETRIMA